MRFGVFVAFLLFLRYPIPFAMLPFLIATRDDEGLVPDEAAVWRGVPTEPRTARQLVSNRHPGTALLVSTDGGSPTRSDKLTHLSALAQRPG